MKSSILLFAAIAIVVVAASMFSVYYEFPPQGEFNLAKQGTVQQPAQTQQALTIQESKISTKTYFYGSGMLASKSSNVVTYYHNDYLGSVRLQSGAAGQKTFASRTAPFGSDVQSSGSAHGAENAYKFTGQEQDSGLYYYGTRYYDTKTGRFTQLDPVLDGASPYAYVSSNPLTHTDPTGTVQVATPATEMVDELLRELGIRTSQVAETTIQTGAQGAAAAGTASTGTRIGLSALKIAGGVLGAIMMLATNPDVANAPGIEGIQKAPRSNPVPAPMRGYDADPNEMLPSTEYLVNEMMGYANANAPPETEQRNGERCGYFCMFEQEIFYVMNHGTMGNMPGTATDVAIFRTAELALSSRQFSPNFEDDSAFIFRINERAMARMQGNPTSIGMGYLEHVVIANSNTYFPWKSRIMTPESDLHPESQEMFIRYYGENSGLQP